MVRSSLARRRASCQEADNPRRRASVWYSMDDTTDPLDEAHVISLGFAGRLVHWRMVGAMVVLQAPLIDGHAMIVAPAAATRLRRAVAPLRERRRGDAYRGNHGDRSEF